LYPSTKSWTTSRVPGRLRQLARRLPRLSGWDWLIGGIVAVAIVLAVVLLGQGLYTKAKAIIAQSLLNQAWAETLETSTTTRPWPWLDTWPVARIEIPRLGRSTVALAGASGQALAFAPALLRQSAMPGTRGTSVFAAHRDTIFTFMADLQKGDRIDITTTTGEQFTYEISGFRVAPWNASGIDADSMDYQLALVTCWPLDATTPGPLRYIAEATLIRSAAALED
jgi:sortase A